MKISVLRRMNYEGSVIYIRQYDYVFEYLFAWESEVYQRHIIIKPALIRAILYLIGLMQSPYSREGLERGESIMLDGAMKSIDALKQPGAKLRKMKAKERAEREKTECVWQTQLIGKDEVPHYYCIKHNQLVLMEQGKTPKHN